MGLWLAASAPLALSAAPDTKALGLEAGVPGSTAMPPSCSLELLVIELSSIAGGASQVSAWLTYDEDGAEGITPQRTTGALQAITPTPTDATIGFVSFALGGIPFRGSTLYVHVLVDAGTASGRAKLYSET